MRPAAPVLAAEDLAFGFGARRVLDGLSLAVGAGELVAVLGPNGAGKTTLLRLLAGLLRPDAGRVRAPEPRALRVAYLAQDEPLPGDFNPRELVALGRLPHQGLWGRETTADRLAVERALARTDLLALADRPVRTLSGGERQRVALARALAGEPSVLLLDEPASHLDIAHQTSLIRLLREETRAGLAAVMVVHDLNLAALAGRCLLLDGGRLLADGPPEQVLVPELLERAYRTRIETLRTPDGRVVVLASAS